MLYRKNFDRIEIIDGQRDCVRLDHPGICAMEMVLAEEISYSGYVTEVMKKLFRMMRNPYMKMCAS